MEYSNLLIDKFARKQEITFEQAIANYNTNHPERLPITTETVYGAVSIDNVSLSNTNIQIGLTGENNTQSIIVSASQESSSKYFAQVSGKQYEVTLTNGKINVSRSENTLSTLPATLEVTATVQDTSIATASASGSTVTITGTGAEGHTTLNLTINGMAYTAKTINIASTSIMPGSAATATTTDNYRDALGKTATVPKGYTVSNVEGEKLISQGLVITKDSNEYVWIEVPKTGGPDYSAVASTTVDTAEYYTAIENALIEYSGFAKTGTDVETTRNGWKDEWYDSSSHTYDGTAWHNYNGTENTSYSGNLEATTGCGLTYEAYNTQYKKMLKSVYTNGGFWIGRYEGSAGASSGDAPLSQPNKTTQTLFCSNAQIAAAKVATTDTGNTGTNTYTSSLMFGVQWDLVCKFLEGSTEWAEGNTPTYYIKSDSSSWGNYSGQGGLKNTGASGYKRMNIYDFAGNQWEWTLEHATSRSVNPRASRGGSYDISGSRGPASCRNSGGESSFHGFRVALY